MPSTTSSPRAPCQRTSSIQRGQRLGAGLRTDHSMVDCRQRVRSHHPVYSNVGTGAIQATFTVPGARGQQGTPTGVVFNSGTGFVVNNGAGTSPARFIFASEDGTISGFRGVPVVIAVDNLATGAVYKGLAIDTPTAGNFLYASNFHAGSVDVFDNHFNPVHMAGAFTDPDLPAGYAPFGIQNIGGTIYLAYAPQDPDKHDDEPGEGHGFRDAFD